MTRSTIRRHVFTLLFRVEFHDEEDLKEQDTLYLNEIEKITEEEKSYITDRVERIVALLSEIDKKIAEISKGWKLNRIGKVELTILRLGVFEILYDEDIPSGVAINEAVELAKLFGGDTSSSFINGVLAKLIA